MSFYGILTLFLLFLATKIFKKSTVIAVTFPQNHSNCPYLKKDILESNCLSNPGNLKINTVLWLMIRFYVLNSLAVLRQMLLWISMCIFRNPFTCTFLTDAVCGRIEMSWMVGRCVLMLILSVMLGGVYVACIEPCTTL